MTFKHRSDTVKAEELKLRVDERCRALRARQQSEVCDSGLSRDDEPAAGAGAADTPAEADGITTKASRKGSSDWPAWSCDCSP